MNCSSYFILLTSLWSIMIKSMELRNTLQNLTNNLTQLKQQLQTKNTPSSKSLLNPLEEVTKTLNLVEKEIVSYSHYYKQGSYELQMALDLATNTILPNIDTLKKLSLPEQDEEKILERYATMAKEILKNLSKYDALLNTSKEHILSYLKKAQDTIDEARPKLSALQLQYLIDQQKRAQKFLEQAKTLPPSTMLLNLIENFKKSVSPLLKD